MRDLEIHAYNVGFGDAILIRIPVEGGGENDYRKVLIDCGNSLTKEGGNDDNLLLAMEAIHALTDGVLDLYIMTHEHMDHVQGLQLLKKRSNKVFSANRVWMTGSSQPGYYDTHENARKRFDLARDFLNIAKDLYGGALALRLPELETILAVNNPRKTADCVHLIREELTHADKVSYLNVDMDQNDVDDITPFDEAWFSILAPEEDTSAYYGRMQHLSVAGPAAAAAVTETVHQPPPGVSLSEFNQLVAARDRGLAANALMIDKAANNSSIVFVLHWQGRKLMFSADAEEKSWHFMRNRDLLEPVDFLKISHHGSHNGTPDHLFDTVLAGRDGARPIALVSTFPGQYNGVPLDDLLEKIATVADLRDTRDVHVGQAVVVTFPPWR